MKTLGIDFGQKKIGLAIADGPLAEPFGVVKTKNWPKSLERICQKEKVERLVVGVSEGKMAEKQKTFARCLEKILVLPVFLVDETLTSKEAIVKMRKLGKKGEEDKFAATLLLQRFLDEKDV